MARSSILLLACLMIVCKSDLFWSIWLMRENHRFISFIIRFCSVRGGKGIGIDFIKSVLRFGWAAPWSIFLKLSVFDLRNQYKYSEVI